jgi:hypothetical protein
MSDALTGRICREHPGQPRPGLVGRVGITEPYRLLDRLEGRPISDALAVRKAAPSGDHRRVRDFAEELAHQPGLANSSRSEHGEELARPILDGSIERIVEAASFPFAADHRRVETARVTGRLTPKLDERNGVPLWLDRDDIAGEAVRLLVEQDLVGSR